MHGEELQYIKEAYETNWMSTVGRISIRSRRLQQKRLRLSMLLDYLAARQLFFDGLEDLAYAADFGDERGL